eukprot:TRINITY_DN4819_c0_g1_i1.p1 TRINITY_DN4819_c0_g1~~TRINITY_DN4819_c0_g1_i1.p1  ORF type:complete len:395 (-),score=89.00 TRINITY_DN4819_c0_g1_i1:55-1239(-)
MCIFPTSIKSLGENFLSTSRQEMISMDSAMQYMISVTVFACVLQFCVTAWMFMGVMGFAGIYIKQGVKKDLLWVQLLLFVFGFLYFLWDLVSYSISYNFEVYSAFCLKYQWMVSSLFTGLFSILFMLFLILKLRAIRLDGKMTRVEKISLLLTVLSLFLTFGHAASMKGQMVTKFDNGYVCEGNGNTTIQTPVFMIDLCICVMALYVFIKRVKTVGQAAAKSLEASRKNVNSISLPGGTAGKTRSKMEELALEARNAGGGAIAIFLVNYLTAVVGIAFANVDEIILLIFSMNVATVFAMCFVIAMFTRRVWVIDENSKFRVLYSMFGSEVLTQEEIQSLHQQRQVNDGDVGKGRKKSNGTVPSLNPQESAVKVSANVAPVSVNQSEDNHSSNNV